MVSKCAMQTAALCIFPGPWTARDNAGALTKCVHCTAACAAGTNTVTDMLVTGGTVVITWFMWQALHSHLCCRGHTCRLLRQPRPRLRGVTTCLVPCSGPQLRAGQQTSRGRAAIVMAIMHYEQHSSTARCDAVA